MYVWVSKCCGRDVDMFVDEITHRRTTYYCRGCHGKCDVRYQQITNEDIDSQSASKLSDE